MRADIYERLNIPTVSTTRWGVKQMILMLTHPGEEIKETLAAGDLFRMRVEIPAHLVGKPVSSLNLEGKILVAGVDRGARGSSRRVEHVPGGRLRRGDRAEGRARDPRGAHATDRGALRCAS